MTIRAAPDILLLKYTQHSVYCQEKFSTGIVRDEEIDGKQTLPSM
jgi:hypothetical protein